VEQVGAGWIADRIRIFPAIDGPFDGPLAALGHTRNRLPLTVGDTAGITPAKLGGANDGG
jgi:hypothetical protein